MKSTAAVEQTDFFFWEKKIVASGCVSLIGIDEAGRGPLAGPVVAAAVRLPKAWYHKGLPSELAEIRDSKKLSAKKRSTLYERIRNHPHICHGIGQIEVNEIDAINILKASHRAMALSVRCMDHEPSAHALVDGLPVHGLPVNHTAVVRGDSKSYTIAAASILAKEFRDRLMCDLDLQYPKYGFAKHKGYGTTEHRRALLKHGPCCQHRKTFLGNLNL
jgi:ribonuclease HII